MNKDIAIIGMAGRFPQADNLDQLHDNLSNFRDSVRKIPKQRMINTALPIEKKYMIAGYMNDIDKFDHKLFGISYKEAVAMDPTQRMLLEVTYEAIENSGYPSKYYSNLTTSVIVGETKTEYYKFADSFSPLLVSGVDKEFVATRIARQFCLSGNAMMIDTACSSSLVAIYQACNEIRLGYTDCAIVCGANINVLPYANTENKLDVFSSDGKSRSFSEDANGMSTGEATVALILKPFELAKKDNDIIYGIIKGIAVNNNADRSASPTAPDSVSQAEVLDKAWKMARIAPDQIGYFEAHGSGTKLGDNIEVEGINIAVSRYTDCKKIFPLSTGKSNMGHAMTASGIVSVCKTLLSINHNCIYPIINFDKPNKLIDFDKSAFFINVEKSVWKEADKNNRIACISAMGVSGTNCHMVISGYEEAKRNIENDDEHILTISSKNTEGLSRNIDKYIEWLMESANDRCFKDICYTANTGRKHYQYRFAAVVKNKEQALELLRIHQLEEKAKPIKAEKIIYVLSDMNGIDDEFIENLKSSSDIFAYYFNKCENILKVKNENTLVFAVQFGLYHTLAEIGINIDNLASIGIGKLVIEAIKKDNLKCIIDRVIGYKNNIQNLSERVAHLVQKSANGATLFIQLGTESEVLRLIRDNKTDKEVYTLHIDTEYKNNLLCFISDLYMYGMEIDWKVLWNGKDVRKTLLPNYSFDKIHCWLRNDSLIADVQIKLQENKAFLIEDDKATLIEKQIAKYFEAVLDVEQISLDDEFFEAGGDSLKATRIILEINKALNVQLNFEDLFDFPTIRKLASYVNSILNIEDKIILIWKIVLNIDKIENNDNFFELGGHSLIANELLAYTESCFDIDINFEDLYYWPTVKQFSEFIKSNLDGNEMKKEAVSDSTDIIKAEADQSKTDDGENLLKITNIEPFTDVLFMNCLYNSLIPVVKAFDKDMGSFLSNTVIQYEYDDREKRAYIIYNEVMSIPDMIIDANFELSGKENNDDYVNDIINAIQAGKTAISSVDCYYLPMRTDTFKKKHLPHTILVYGIDLKDQLFIILEHDHFNSLNYKETYISFNDLLSAYNGYIEYLKDNDEGIGYTYIELGRNSMQNIKSENYTDRYIKNYLNKKENILHGIDSLKIWIDYMSDVLFDEDKLRDYTRVIDDLTYIINAKKLERYVVKQLFDNKRMNRIIENVVSDWNQIRSTLSKYFITKVYKESSMSNTVQLIKNIVDNEKSMVELMDFDNR